MKYVSERIKRLILDFAPTGSMEICDPPPTDTDEDYIIYVSEMNRLFIKNLLEEDGWKLGGSHENEDRRFLSFKKRINDVLINLIFTFDKIYFDSFVHATLIAKQLNLMKKSDRVELFRIVRDSYEG